MRRNRSYECDRAGVHHPATETTETYLSCLSLALQRTKLTIKLQTGGNCPREAILGCARRQARQSQRILVKPADVLKSTTTATMITARDEADTKHLDEAMEASLN